MPNGRTSAQREAPIGATQGNVQLAHPLGRSHYFVDPLSTNMTGCTRRRDAMATGVFRFSGGPIPPGGSEIRAFWVGYPNNNPDLSLTWELRAIRQAGHAGHPMHKVRLDLI